MARAALLVAAALGAACLPETAAWIDGNILCRRTSNPGSHGVQDRCRATRPAAAQVRWCPRRNMDHSRGFAARGVPPLFVEAGGGGGSNATVNWMMDVQLTRTARVSTNSSSSGRPSNSSRRKNTQRPSRTGPQPSNDGKREPRREGNAEGPVGEGAMAKEGVAEERREQQAARDRSGENDVNKAKIEGGIAADSSDANGRKRQRKGKAEARLRPRNPRPPGSSPPPAREPQAAAEEGQGQGEEEREWMRQGGGAGEAQRGTSSPPSSAESSRKTARGFGKPKPPMDTQAAEVSLPGVFRARRNQAGEEGVSKEGPVDPDFAKVVKFLSLRPEEYARAREILIEIFGPDEVGPWIAELESAAKSQGMSSIPPAPAPAPPVAAVPPPAPASSAAGNGRDKERERSMAERREGGQNEEEVTLPVEQLGLKRRGVDARSSSSSSSSSSREGEGKAKVVDEEEEAEEVDEEEDVNLVVDLGLPTTEEGVGGVGEDGDESVIKDKRVVSTHIKDAKLSEYIKDKKNARTTRDKFLADMGIVRSEVHPPQRFIEVYYNTWADDFYTAITTSSNRFGPRWWFREALSHSASDVMAWLRKWYRMAKKHRVLHDDVAAMLSEALREEDDDSGPVLSETQRYDALKDRIRRWREPRIIAIGDVHGCIEELRALLKKVEYSPGDLVIFLGDIVAKGPDSVDVVRLAREIGALSVRGNHENEVIRWSRAMALGAQSNFKSEHYLIALALSEEDLEWLRSLPWYISCSDMQLLFVHAGFVSNLRLSKQHPRFMINMRSILADGTVSARYYQDYPWARTWQGPQTVLFGHDARRGMQAYDQALGLDTGCVYGGNLTACLIPGKQIVQVPAAEPYIVNRYERIMRRAEHLKDSRKDPSQGE